MRKKQEKIIMDYMTDSIIEALSADTVEKIMTDWESIYCPLSKKEKDKIYFSDLKWHVFSNKAYEALEGEAALKAYNEQISRIFYVIPELKVWPEEKAFTCHSLPTSKLATQFSNSATNVFLLYLMLFI